MGLLIDGQWHDRWYASRDGKFEREQAKRRHWARPPDGQGGFKAEAGRYHLYVSLACPWAHRTLIYRKLKGLEPLIDVSVVSWLMAEHGWTFDKSTGSSGDALDDLDYLHQRYSRDDPKYSGRVTVPVLWDRERQCIVNNESAEIIRIFNDAFDELTGSTLDFYPEALHGEIDALNARIYPAINNGVYRAGFATTQDAYEEAFDDLFRELDWLERRLGKQRYLTGEYLTEADWRLFTTIIRFDAVYHGHFAQPAPHRGLSEPLELAARAVPVAGYRRDRGLHPHQAPLLRQPSADQRHWNRPKGPALGLERTHDRERLPGRGIWTRPQR